MWLGRGLVGIGRALGLELNIQMLRSWLCPRGRPWRSELPAPPAGFWRDPSCPSSTHSTDGEDKKTTWITGRWSFSKHLSTRSFTTKATVADSFCNLAMERAKQTWVKQIKQQNWKSLPQQSNFFRFTQRKKRYETLASSFTDDPKLSANIPEPHVIRNHCIVKWMIWRYWRHMRKKSIIII